MHQVQSINLSMNQPINPPINLSIHESINPSIRQSINPLPSNANKLQRTPTQLHSLLSTLLRHVRGLRLLGLGAGGLERRAQVDFTWPALGANLVCLEDQGYLVWGRLKGAKGNAAIWSLNFFLVQSQRVHSKGRRPENGAFLGFVL